MWTFREAVEAARFAIDAMGVPGVLISGAGYLHVGWWSRWGQEAIYRVFARTSGGRSFSGWSCWWPAT